MATQVGIYEEFYDMVEEIRRDKQTIQQTTAEVDVEATEAVNSEMESIDKGKATKQNCKNKYFNQKCLKRFASTTR